MWIDQKNLLFVHIPKTGGNFIQKSLLPYSSDTILADNAQDGVDTFKVSGLHTKTKHSGLEAYKSSMEEEVFNRLLVATAVRHPLDRMLSLYFSPHRWRTPNYGYRAYRKLFTMLGRAPSIPPHAYRQKKIVFDEKAFEKLVKSTPKMVDYLTVDNKLRQVDFLVKYETFEHDIKRVFDTLRISPPQFHKAVNSSVFKEKSKLRDSKILHNIVLANHLDDFEQFGYETKVQK